VKLLSVLARIWRLARLAASGPAAWVGLGLFAIVVGLELVSIWITLQLIAWNANFFDALENFDAGAAVRQIGVFLSLILFSALCFLVGDYLRKYVLIRWRTRLTDIAMAKWLSGHAYWLLREGLSPTPLENPDQRIAEDCRLFVSGLLHEAIDLFSRIVGLFSYVTLLWSLSNFALPIQFGRIDLEIPRYLVWASFVYVLLSSIMTHLLGWPLKGLLFQREKREADFRFALMQLRDNASEVAMTGGEQAERRRFDKRYAGVVQNWHQLIRREFVVGLFTRPYFQTVLRIPLFLSLPAYMAGRVTLGGLMQLASAFSNVTTTLSWFIFSYRDLADFVATSERLDQLLAMLDEKQAWPDTPSRIAQDRAAGWNFRGCVSPRHRDGLSAPSAMSRSRPGGAYGSTALPGPARRRCSRPWLAYGLMARGPSACRPGGCRSSRKRPISPAMASRRPFPIPCRPIATARTRCVVRSKMSGWCIAFRISMTLARARWRAFRAEKGNAFALPAFCFRGRNGSYWTSRPARLTGRLKPNCSPCSSNVCPRLR
jgi:ABC-type long-subunit fatty acid transport system fused permease/ATPase subunit